MNTYMATLKYHGTSKYLCQDKIKKKIKSHIPNNWNVLNTALFQNLIKICLYDFLKYQLNDNKRGGALQYYLS